MLRILIICTLNISVCCGQINLVPNPSFETVNLCPTIFSNIYKTEFTYVDQWLIPTLGTSDYYNSCATPSSEVDIPTNAFTANLPARTGEAYCGIYIYHEGGIYREYLQTQLIEPMDSGLCYYVELWISPGTRNSDYPDEENLTTDAFGIHFSPTRKTDFLEIDTMGFAAQVNNMDGQYIINAGGWTKVSGFYQSTGGEEWMIIGNFLADNQTTRIPIPGYPFPDGLENIYFYVDDIKVVATPYDFLPDTTLCGGQLLEWTIEVGEGTYIWSTGDSTNTGIIDTAGVYWLSINNVCGTVSDSATVHFLPYITSTTSTELIVCAQELPTTIVASGLYDDYQWSTGSTNVIVDINSAGTYYVEGHIDCDLFVDTFHVVVIPEIPGMTDDFTLYDTLICEDDFQLFVDGPDGFDEYLWNTGDTTKSVIIESPGTYWVAYYLPCYQFIEYFTIKTDPYLNADLALGPDDNLCLHDGLIQLDAGELPEIIWNNGETGRFLFVTNPGIYYATAVTLCKLLSDTITIFDCDFENHQLYLSPTVSFGELWLFSDSEYLTGEVLLEVFSVQGKVDELYLWLDGRTQVDFSFYAKGYYLVKATAGTEVYWFDIILQ